MFYKDNGAKYVYNLYCLFTFFVLAKGPITEV